MHGEHRPSIAQKLVMVLARLLTVYIATWLLFGGGIERVSAGLDSARLPGDPMRGLLLLSFMVFYLLRSTTALFVFIRRRIGWSEALGVAGLLVVVELVFVGVGGIDQRHLGISDYAAVGLYFLGSWLNTEAELERFLFKRDPTNRDRLFTGGLFHYAMHINYLGEVLLFTGFALLTGVAWSLLIPAAMLAGFVFVHIPALDRHLATRYGDDFVAWAQDTHRLIPFIY